MSRQTRLVLADPLAREGVAILEAEHALRVDDFSSRNREELKEALAGAAGLIVRSTTQADADLIEAGDSLRVIGRAGVGLDNIDVEAATRRGIAVMNAPAGNTVSTAELTLALLMAAARRIPSADRSVRAGEWNRKAYRGTQLAGKWLGVIGAGRIGAEVILRARAFGMKVMVADPFMTPGRAADLSVELLELDDMLPRADFITLHVPLTPDTRGLMSDARMRLLKPTTILVNAARGGILDETALAEALTEGRLAGAALDVYEAEPLPESHPLRHAPNLIMTPHLGAATQDAQRHVAIEIARAVRAALVDGDYRTAVNMPPSLPRDRDRLEPVLDLAERLGAVLAEVARGGVISVSVSYGGEVQRGLRLIASAALIGLLRGRLEASLNLINALVLARDRGIGVSRQRVGEVTGYRGMVEIGVETPGEKHSVVGGIESDGQIRMLRVDGYHVGVEPRGNLLIIRNDDVPGVIGDVGTRLGTAGVNIAELHHARDAESGQAFAVLSLDEELDPRLVKEIQAIPAVRRAGEIRLDT
jgi:D-3-phosphoglycerate dehydrogenase